MVGKGTAAAVAALVGVLAVASLVNAQRDTELYEVEFANPNTQVEDVVFELCEEDGDMRCWGPFSVECPAGTICRFETMLPSTGTYIGARFVNDDGTRTDWSNRLPVAACSADLDKDGYVLGSDFVRALLWPPNLMRVWRHWHEKCPPHLPRH